MQKIRHMHTLIAVVWAVECRVCCRYGFGIAFIHVARALWITSQSLSPWPKGRCAKGPVLKGKPKPRY